MLSKTSTENENVAPYISAKSEWRKFTSLPDQKAEKPGVTVGLAASFTADSSVACSGG
jgi:hypothetical protein